MGLLYRILIILVAILIVIIFVKDIIIPLLAG